MGRPSGSLAPMPGPARQWRSLIAGGVLAAALLPASGHAAAPPPANPFGVNGGVLFPDGDRRLDTALHTRAIAAAGLGTVRAVAFWDQIEPQAPDPALGKHAFVWRRTDDLVGGLATNGLRWEPVLGFSTAWGGVVPGTAVGEPRAQPFSEFAAALAGRYGRRGAFWREHPEMPYVPVTGYEVWNEPNIQGSLTSLQAPAYAGLYIAARTAIKAVDGAARVAVGGLVDSAPPKPGTESLPYLREMFAARPELAGDIDAVGLTVYRPTPAGVVEKVAQARKELDALGERVTPIDLHETGWTTMGGVLLTDLEPISESQRTAFMADLVGRLATSDCGVGTVLPFAWVGTEANPLDAADWFGLADRGNAVPKPSGSAYAQAVRDALPGIAAGGPCGRPDLPPMIRGEPAGRGPFVVTVRRGCSGRRSTVRVSLGEEAEPWGRVVLGLPGRRRRTTLRDPDDGGSATLRTALRVRFKARQRGTVRATAFDELGRVRARARARLARCSHPRRSAATS